MPDLTAFFAAVREAPFGGRLLQPQVDGLNVLIAAWPADGDQHQLAYLLASAFHETASTMRPIYEKGPRHYFDKYEPGTKLGRDLGNTRAGDGYLFRGRGFVQLTGRANYAHAGADLGIDMVGTPDLAMEPATAARIIVRGMTEGWFTGKKLADYIHGGNVDYIGARHIINGTDRATTIGLYARSFAAALA